MSRTALALALGLLAAGAAAQDEPPDDAEAALSQLQGAVYLHTAAQADGEFIAAEEDAPLAVGDHVRTGTDGSAEVSLADHSVIELGHNSDFLVDSLDPKETEFHLGIGSLVAKLKKLLAGNKMTFRTPTAVCAVRGTELALEQEDDAQPTRVGVFDEGRVSVRSANGAEEISVGPGEETEVGREGPPAKARPLRALRSRRQALLRARENLAGLPGRWKRRSRAERAALRAGFAKKRALRAEKLSNIRGDIRRRVYENIRKRRQALKQSNKRGAFRKKRKGPRR